MSSNGRLQGKAAIITGGAQGFGAGIVDYFRREGANVLLVDLSEEQGRAKAKESGSVFFRADVSKRASWEAILEEVKRTFGRLDTIVSNAGWTYPAKSSLDVTEAEFERVFAINVSSFFHATSVLLPYMQDQARGGSFITISSTAALRPRPRLTWYNATKGAVSIASKSLALEMAPHQIRFNTICPVAGNTPLLATFAGGQLTEKTKDVFMSSIPLGRLSEPSDIAAAVGFLASDEAAFITGVDLGALLDLLFPTSLISLAEVDGGRCV